MTREGADCCTERYWASSQGGRGAQNLERGPAHLVPPQPAALLARGNLQIPLQGQRVSLNTHYYMWQPQIEIEDYNFGENNFFILWCGLACRNSCQRLHVYFWRKTA